MHTQLLNVITSLVFFFFCWNLRMEDIRLFVGFSTMMICARQAPDQIGWTIDFYSVLTLFPNEQNQFRNKHEEKKKTSMKTNVACLYITHYRLLFLFKGKFYHSRALLLTKWMRDSNLGYIWCDYEFAHHYTKKKENFIEGCRKKGSKAYVPRLAICVWRSAKLLQ